MYVPQTEVILSHEGHELAHVTLPPGEYVIGRAPEVEIHAETPLISRQHARLTINYDHLLIEDLGSSNGTFIADKPITESTRIFPNQDIRLGDVQVEVRRQRATVSPGESLAPSQATMRRILPEEVLSEKRYAIGDQVARGGMGAILKASQTALQRPVAMKVMLDSGDPGDVLRFVEEAQVTGQLTHPNIVPVYELGIDEHHQLFYTMKLVRGITLKKVLELLAQGMEGTRKKYPLSVLLTVFQKACDAIAFAHAKGVIHRDLKPENVMIGDFGEVLVMDWGLAKVLGRPSEDTSTVVHSHEFVASARTAQGDSGSTLAGSIMGTPAYMSPEQARGEVERIDVRSDIYALGTILFELLHLRPAVSGTDAMQIVERVGRGEVEWTAPAPSGAKKTEVPSSLLAVCRKALAPSRSARYQSVENLQADIVAYQNGFATSAEHAGLGKQFVLAFKRHKTAAIAALLVILAVGGFGTRAVIAGRQAERALADLKKTAPSLLQLAESEAGFQRFDSALQKIETALTLDPGLHRAYWTRAWVLLGQEKWNEAIEALQQAQRDDPANAKLAAILPEIQHLAAQTPKERESSAEGEMVLAQLQEVGAAGSVSALSKTLKMDSKAKLVLVQKRLDEWLGPNTGGRVRLSYRKIAVTLENQPITTIEPLRGLPLDSLNINGTKVADLEPLRGMPLRTLMAVGAPIESLAPLAGLPLEHLELRQTKVTDLSPLHGLPLHELGVAQNPVTDLSPLHGMPLQNLNLMGTLVRDLSPLSGMPLDSLSIESTRVVDLSPLHGMPLKGLVIRSAGVVDLTPLRGLALEALHMNNCSSRIDLGTLLEIPSLVRLRITDGNPTLEKLRHHPGLREIDLSGAKKGFAAENFRPVAQFWAEYDATHPTAK
jgi:tetratricopeptide (TPR) repeat protein/tRNA A-37 threonylcarbamoyl transferase component Bud32